MKIVLAGTSHWHADMHLDAARSTGAEVIGVWDEDEAHARSFATRNSLSAIATFEDVLATPADLILLMGHPSAVPARARSVIEADLPLVLEKPAAINTAQLAQLRDLARERKTFVGVPLPNRLLASLNGLLLGAYIGGAFLEMGQPYLLQSIAAVVLGGTLIFGGSATALGTLFASILLILIVTTMQIIGLPPGAQDIVQGVVVIFVLALAGRQAMAKRASVNRADGDAVSRQAAGNRSA